MVQRSQKTSSHILAIFKRLMHSGPMSYPRLALALLLGLGVVEPALNPSSAQACFFWQACARQGQASNTRAGGKRTSRILGGNDASIPYIISPRNSWIQQPGLQQAYIISWNPVAGVDSYTVKLWQWTYEGDLPDFALWETTVENTNQVSFPALVLAPGNYYSIEVVTDTGISSDLDAGYFDSGFQLLFDEDYTQLRSRLNELTSAATAEVTNEDTALAIAGILFLEEMYADALDSLQTLAANTDASNLVYTALGDTYAQSGLTQLAVDAYQQALTLAINNNDIPGEATIRVNLANVYATLRQFDASLQQLLQARAVYSQLQAPTEVIRLDRRIAIISTRVAQEREDTSGP